MLNNSGKTDIIWNYVATMLRISSSIILFPLVLKILSVDQIAVWSIFNYIIIIATLFDFGFNPSFSRNVTYIFSGAKTLIVEGIEEVNDESSLVNYDLLKNLIWSMKRFYFFVSISLFLIQVSVGTFYIKNITESYTGSLTEVFISWFLVCFLTFLTLCTSYYDVLLQGLGLVKISKQIWVIGQTLNLFFSAFLLLNGYGLVSLVIAQIISVVVIRIFSHRAFYTKNMKVQLQFAQDIRKYELLKVISPNAFKIGLTTLGGVLVSRSTLIIGSLFLPLSVIASYGISVQIVSVVASLAGVYLSSFQPKIAQLQVFRNIAGIKKIYLKGIILGFTTYGIFAITLILFGKNLFIMFDKEDLLLPKEMLFFMFLFSLLEFNHSSAGNILLSGNKVPFFKSSLLSGIITVFLLFIFLKYTSLGIYGVIFAPGIAHLYNNFKWPYEAFKLLKIDVYGKFWKYF